MSVALYQCSHCNDVSQRLSYLDFPHRVFVQNLFDQCDANGDDDDGDGDGGLTGYGACLSPSYVSCFDLYFYQSCQSFHYC